MIRPNLRSTHRSWTHLGVFLLLMVSSAGCDMFGQGIDQRAPRVTIERPFDRATVSGRHVLVLIDAEPLGEDNWVSFININLDGVRIGEAEQVGERYAYRWDTTTLPDGLYRLEAVAYDRNQSRGVSTPLVVRIENTSPNPGPVLRIIEPSAQKNVSGLVRVVAQRLSGPDYSSAPIQQVNFIVDGVVVHTDYGDLANGLSYVYDWDTTGEVLGTRVLQVKAYASADAFSLSDPVEVVVESSTDEGDGGDPVPGSLISKSAGIRGTITGAIAIGFNNFAYVPSTWRDADTGLETGRITAFDDTGKLVWTFDAKGPIRRAPVIGNNEDVYAVSEDGRLYAMSPLSGNVLWYYQPDVVGFANPTAPSLGVDGVLWFGDSRGYLHAVNTFNGQAVAGYPKQVTGSTSISIVAPPVITPDRTVIVGDNRGMLLVIPLNRAPEWVLLGSGIQKPMAVIQESLSLTVPGQATQNTTSDVIFGVLENGAIFRADLLDLANYTLSPIPSDPIEYPATGPIVGPDQTVYVGTGRSLVAWDKDLRSILYRVPGYRDPLGSSASTPHGVSMVAIDSDEVIHYTSGESVFAMNSNGTPVWNYNLDTTAPNPSTITRNGHLLVGGTNGIMFRFETGSTGLAQSMWPMYQRNARHLGRQGLDANDN